MTHTPGPWIVNPFCAQVDCSAVSAKGGLLPVAQMLWPTDERSEAETEANARLIAEAPTLLHEAAFLLDRIADLDWCDFDRFANDWSGHVDPPLERLRAAIARANPGREVGDEAG